ncbi:MAG: hypothetical protein ACKVTZ_05625 [Bacteroidia bacterium]
MDNFVALPNIQNMEINYIEKRFQAIEPLIRQGLVLLVTATETETNHLHQKMKPLLNEEGLIEVKKDNATYYIGLFGNFAVANVECGTMGSSTSMGSTLTVTNAINVLQPKFVLMVGIAFGIDDEKQNIGDVLVSDKLIPYEMQRVSANAIVWRGSKPEANNSLRNSFKIKKWDNLLPNEKTATLELCDILTGEKLVDNIDYRNELLTLFPTAKGGEMEGAGLYAACQDKSLPWLLVKAICDFADGQKREGKKEKQALAIEMALRACLAVFNKQYVFEGFGMNVFEGISPIENPPTQPKEENKIHVAGDNNIVISGSHQNNIHIQQGTKISNDKSDKSTLIALLENDKIPTLLEEMDKLSISDKFQYNRLKKEYQAGLQGINLIDWQQRMTVFINSLN